MQFLTADNDSYQKCLEDYKVSKQLGKLREKADGMIEFCKKSVQSPEFNPDNNGYYQAKVSEAFTAAGKIQSIDQALKTFREYLCKYCNYQK